MGDHYVPRFYLARFASDPGHLIWAYDRNDNRKYRTNIINVAQQSKFYSTELEQRLSKEVEAPVAPIVRKIANGETISAAEKRVLASYLLLQWKRTPKGKERFGSLIPAVAEETRKELIEKLEQLAVQSPSGRVKAEARKVEVDEVIESYKTNPPVDIWHQSLTVQTHSSATNVLNAMHWRFFVAPDGEQFIANDNPVFFFEHLGLSNREAELTIPLSTNIALWASWRENYPPGYLTASPATVRELNRRTAKNARRYVYAKQDAHWILPLILKKFHRLNRLA